MPTFSDLARKRGYLCDCGCNLRAEDRHHCFVPNLKRFPQMDVEENIVLVSHWEHTDERKFDNPKWRQYFWIVQCNRYGEEHMIEWLASWPKKLDNRKDFLPVSDGFGSSVSRICPQCGKATMQVVRPGDFRCSDCP